MSICSRCGNSIEFRYIGGKCIPLHLNGGCIGYGTASIADYSGYNTCNESACFSTNCPKCKGKVYFLRHNGGSVWIDPPLGPPWFKHACFDDNSTSIGGNCLVDDYKNEFQKLATVGLVLGVVKSTNVNSTKSHTKVIVESGEFESLSLGVKNNAGYLLGRLCLIEEKANYIWPIESPKCMFKILHFRKISTEPIKCPECGVEVLAKNMLKHLRRQHNSRQTIDASHMDSYLSH